jgi:3-isopropylmalate/(R)-2-methylmalate dehydratase large subunit
MSPLQLSGHEKRLYLCEDPSRITRQLNGVQLTLAQAGRLRDDVSTDEITPVSILSYYDERLGEFAHTGLKCADQTPIARRVLLEAGFAVLVAGRRYGKGSSREHSPTAEKLAGIQLVIAESFERIYRQNADNIGLFTSTDFSLLDRLEKGDALTIEDLVADRDPLSAAVLRAGGLLHWGQKHLVATAITTSHVACPVEQPLTLFEKILTRRLLPTPYTPDRPYVGAGVFVRTDWRFIHEYYTGMAHTLMNKALDEHMHLVNPEQIVVFEDHTSYVHESPAHISAGLIPNMLAMSQAQLKFVQKFEHASNLDR